MNKYQLIKLKNKGKWPRGTAGNKIITEIPLAMPDQTIREVKKIIEKNINLIETINYIYVINKKNKLIGVFSIKELFRHLPTIKVSNIMIREYISIRPESDEGVGAYQAIYHNIKAIPVITKDKTLLGIVPADSIQKILKNKLTKTIRQIAGLTIDVQEYEDPEQIPILKAYRHRVPWLIIGLLGGIFIANIIGFFENTLRENIVLAGFIPVITYISNAVAIQVQILFIRDLAMHHKIKIRKYFAKQLAISFLIALTCILLLIVSSSFGWIHHYTIFVIGVAMLFTIMFAVCFALIVPYTLKKLKFDPGVASGPFSTIIQDTSSVVLYFLIVSLLL